MKHLECALEKGNQFWKYIIVLVISFVLASIVGSIPLIAVVMVKIVQNGGDIASMGNSMSNMSQLNALGISSNLSFALMVLPLVLGVFILLFFIKIFHKRSYKEVINGTKSVRWKRVITGAACWTVLMILYFGIDYAMNPSNYVLQFDLSLFIPLVILSLVMLPFQTSFEELAFRGYFAQGLGALTKNRWVVMLIPSIIFGLLHISNPEVKEFGFALMIPQYILIGVLFGLMSTLDDGIELAMGAHAANNIFLSLFITHSASAFQTAAVFSVQEINPYKELISLIVMGVILIAFFYKKYNWKFSTLNKRVEKVEENSDTNKRVEYPLF